MDILEIIKNEKSISPLDEGCETRVKKAWDKVAKPLDSLGKFESFISRIGAIQGSVRPSLNKAGVLVFCSDNGIVEEGISQSTKEVTALCAKSISAKKSCMGIMARRENIEVITVDVGIDSDEHIENVINKKIAHGTKNFLKEPAMSRDEMLSAMQAGFDMVCQCKKDGYDILGIGEMGIGNTTTSSAVAALLLDLDGAAVTGRGAGLSDEGLARKISVVDAAKSKYGSLKADALKVLASVGGFDIAAMAGACIAGAYIKLPIVLDGFISMVAALIAFSCKPDVISYLIPSHKSREKAARLIEEKLMLQPVIDADMALGEGSGAVLMISLLKTALLVLNESNSFDDIKVDEYQRYDKKDL